MPPMAVLSGVQVTVPAVPAIALKVTRSRLSSPGASDTVAASRSDCADIVKGVGAGAGAFFAGSATAVFTVAVEMAAADFCFANCAVVVAGKGGRSTSGRRLGVMLALASASVVAGVPDGSDGPDPGDGDDDVAAVMTGTGTITLEMIAACGGMAAGVTATTTATGGCWQAKPATPASESVSDIAIRCAKPCRKAVIELHYTQKKDTGAYARRAPRQTTF